MLTTSKAPLVPAMMTSSQLKELMERWEVVLRLSKPIEEPMKAVRRAVRHWKQPGTRRACIRIQFEIKGLEAGKQVDQGLEGRKE